MINFKNLINRRTLLKNFKNKTAFGKICFYLGGVGEDSF